MPNRRLTSVAVRLAGRIYLFDCGEGTQVPYKHLHLGMRSLRLIAVTHLHADHCLGLPGMLMLRAQMPDPGPLMILGPPGLKRFITHVRDDLAMFINYEIKVREWNNGADTIAFRDDQVTITWRPVKHSVFCLGYRLEEQDRPGRFDAVIADQLGIPWGPQRGRLQAGEPITLPDGRLVEPDQVIGPPRRGRRVAFITDTGPAPSLASLLKNVDLAFVEGMFLAEHRVEAEEKKHLTAEQAAGIADQAGVSRLVLVHLSPRYLGQDTVRMEAEAAQYHPRAQVARDGECFTVPLPD